MADVYYLDANNGRDTYPGTSSQPFKTFGEAKDHLRAGDKLIVRNGNYNERVTITRSGTKNNPIIIQAENKWGAKIVGDWTGWNFRPGKPNASMLPSGAVPGTGGYVAGVQFLVQANYVHVIGLECKQSEYRAFQAGQDRDKPMFKGVKFIDCYAHHCYESGFTLYNMRDALIYRCKVYEVSMRGRFRDANNIVENHPVVIALSYSGTCGVVECEIGESGGEGIGLGQGGMGGTIVFEGKEYKGNFALRNEVYNNRTPQIYTDWAGNGGTIDRNLIYWTSTKTENGQPSRGINVRDEHRVENRGQVKFEIHRSRNIDITNNIIVGAGRGIWLTGLMNLENYYIANNTFVNCTNGIEVEGRHPIYTNFRYRKDTIIENNVSDCASNKVPTSEGITWRNNCWRSLSAAPSKARGNGDIYANPQLADRNASYSAGNIDATNYYPTSSSPFRNKARASNKVSVDYRGAPRDNTPDMGAVEYQASGAGSIAASFTGTPTSGSKPLTVSFANASSSTNGINAYLYEWRVSGGTWAEFSTSQNPSFTFPAAGTYDVRLTVTGPDGSDTQTRTGYVTVTDSTVVTDELVTDGTFDDTFTNNWTKAPSGLTANTGSNVLALSTISGLSNPQFYQTVSVEAGKSYTLTFDAYAGSSSVSGVRIRLRQDTSPYTIYGLEDVATLGTSSTSYTYTFTCTTTDTAARLQFLLPNTTQTLYFDNISLKETTLIGEEISADFTADATGGETPLSVTFTDLSEASTEIIQWSWESSDDGEATWTEFSTSQNPTESFTAGTYSIRLTVSTSDSSASVTKSEYIEVTTGASAGQSGTDLTLTATPTSTGYQEITLDLDEEAVGFLFVVSGATADDTATDEALFCIGFSDGVNEAAVAIVSEHGQGTMDTNNRGVTDKCCLIIDDSGGVVGEANFVSASSTSLTIDWTTAPSSAYKMMVLAFTHADAQVFTFEMNSSTDGVTAVPLDWDASAEDTLLILASTDDAIDDGVNYSARMCIGFADGTNQASMFLESITAVAASNVRGNVSSTKALTFVDATPSVDYEGEIAYTSSGFNCTTRTGTPSGVDVCGIAIKLADGNSAYVTTAATPTSTGDQAYSGWGIAPNILFTLGGLFTADDTPADASIGSMSLGVATTDSEYSIGWSDEDAAGTSNTQSLAATAALSVPSQDGSAGYEATLSSFDSTGVTLNYDPVLGSARRVVLAAIEQDQFTIPAAEVYISAVDPDVGTSDLDIEPDAATITASGTNPTVNQSDIIFQVSGATITMSVVSSPIITMPGSTVLKPRARAHTLTARRKEVGSVFGVREEPLWISTVESRYYTINPTTISDYGTPSAIVSTSLYDVTDPNAVTNVTSTGISGSSSVSNGSIITAFVDGTALTNGNEYELEVVFTNTRGETVLVTAEVIASRRG